MEAETATVHGSDESFPPELYIDGCLFDNLWKMEQEDVPSGERKREAFPFLSSMDHLHFLSCCDNIFLFVFDRDSFLDSVKQQVMIRLHSLDLTSDVCIPM